MKRIVKTTPEGVRDLLSGECALRRNVESKLMGIFSQNGYSEIITPALEYYDVFSFDTSYIPMHEMYKLTDLNGRLLVLRPDITVPIARIVATRLKDEPPPIKLSYCQNIFRITPNFSGQRDEIAQCGVELIGVGGIKADLEMITMAIDSLRSFCGDSFRFEIGSVNFLKSLIGQLPLNEAAHDEIYELMRTKNYAPLNDRLSGYAHLKAARGLMRLPRLFGGVGVLDEAMEFAVNEEAADTIRYLREVYDYTRGLGINEHVIIDLGVVPENAYYTGIVFRGYQLGAGTPVLSGGRYDKLLKEFGRDLHALGFAVYTDEAVKSGLRRGARP